MPRIKRGNLFSKLPEAKDREAFQALQKGKGFKIERIVSRGQATPEGKWLHSKTAEWVILLRGRASLCSRGVRKKIDLTVGDYVLIPANTYHCVDWTASGQKTVWLAVHLPAGK